MGWLNDRGQWDKDQGPAFSLWKVRIKGVHLGTARFTPHSLLKNVFLTGHETLENLFIIACLICTLRSDLKGTL